MSQQGILAKSRSRFGKARQKKRAADKQKRDVEAVLSGGPISPEDPRKLINRKVLWLEIEALCDRHLSEQERRGAIILLLKGALEAGRKEIKARLEDGLDGLAAARANSYRIDQLVRLLYDYVTKKLYPASNPSTGEVLSLVALGGYGRGELAPHSDIDLLFLLPYKLTPRSEQVTEELLYFLWDLKFKVGHAVRSVDDCIRMAKGDHVICTSILEARWLWGDQALYLDLKRRFRREIQGGFGSGREAVRYIEAKLTEREKRHRKLGDSRYSLEPNIKDGKGGLRDLQSLFWIAKFIYNVDSIDSLVEKGVFTRKEVRRFRKAESHLWTLRFYLHDEARRAEERLTFDFQMAIAPRLGYTAHAGSQDVERFMKHYFLVAKDVGALTRIFCAFLESQHKRRTRFRLGGLRRRRVSGFLVEGDRVTVGDAAHFKEKPIDLLRIFHAAQESELDIHPQALRWVTQSLKFIDKSLRCDKDANEIFLKVLTNPKDPETALRRMNEAGVMGKFLPDFGRVVAQMQYNMYHHYTVDEHTVFAIGILHAVEQGILKEEAPIASEVVHKVVSRRVLYLAVLLHDIAKGRPGDHSEVGARIARKLCPRLGLSDAETETVAWLVLHHLAMSDTAFKRDLGDPQTIQDFVGLVQSPERLRLLLVLTVADIRAVGPNTWTHWKAALLRDLYWFAEERLSGGIARETAKGRLRLIKEEISERLEGWTKKDITALLRRGSEDYWLSGDMETLLRQGAFMREAEKSGEQIAIDIRIDDYRQATEVTVYTEDSAGLFSRLAGAFAVAGASIVDAHIATLLNGKALDSFFIEDATGGPFDNPRKLVRLRRAIRDSVAGKLKPLQELAAEGPSYPSRYRVFKVPPRVLIDNEASRDHTVVEVNGRDRPGLLYEVALALTGMRLVIRRARIATFGERVVDVFYLQDKEGNKIESKRRQATIEEKLMAALQASGSTPTPPRGTSAQRVDSATMGR